MILREGPKTIDVEFDNNRNKVLPASRRRSLVRCGPTLPILVGFDPAYDAKIADSFPDLAGDETTARVDTGAQVSCIDRALVQRLKLPFLREGAIATIHQLNKADEYHAQVRIDCWAARSGGHFAKSAWCWDSPGTAAALP
jgi:hypothetical protein